MHTIKQWKAKRAGGRMTVYGKDEAGNDVKVVGVDYIERFRPEGDAPAITIAVMDHVTPTRTYQLAD